MSITVTGVMNDFYQGETIVKKVSFVDSTSTPINITGWKIYMTFKTYLTDGDPGVAQIVVNSSSLTNPIGGYTDITIPSSTTSLMSGSYFVDIRAIKNDGSVLEVLPSQSINVLIPATQATT